MRFCDLNGLFQLYDSEGTYRKIRAEIAYYSSGTYKKITTDEDTLISECV